MKLDDLMQAANIGSDGAKRKARPNAVQQRELDVILAVVEKVNTSLVLADVLNLVLDEAIRIACAERGFLMLADTTGKLQFTVGRDAEGNSLPVDGFRVSSTVLEDVFRSGESIVAESAMTHERFVQRESIMSLELQTILCSPLRARGETIGVIYVDSKSIQPLDKEETLRIFEILAGQAAIAIRNARLYEDLARAYQELKDTNQKIIQFERMAMKGEIAAEVSHELKNHVAVVLSSLQNLHRGLATLPVEETRTMVESAIYATKKIQKFSQNFLSRSRAKAVRTPMSMSAVVYHFVDFIRTLPKFRRNVIQLTLADDLPAVDLDLDQIQQVLLNLVANASEASPTATIELKTERDAKGGGVVLSIQDNGPGIPMEIQERLFREKITTKPDGHGYGLPICRHIIESHGGNIQVGSIPNHGTVFTITIPFIHERSSEAQPSKAKN